MISCEGLKKTQIWKNF